MFESLNPKERIRKQKDFSLLYRKGNRFNGRYISLIYLPNDLNFSRLAAIASIKNVGNAVKRNKVRRWIRTLFRRNKEALKTSLDIIAIANKGIHKASWKMVHDEYLKAITNINIKSRVE
jgi:ribonuclease P protein component